MTSSLHRSALFLVVLAAAAVISGAFITSSEVVAKQPQTSVAPVAIRDGLHRILGVAVTLFTLGIAIWISRSRAPVWLRGVAWSAVATLVLSVAMGWHAPPLSPAAGVFHALTAHLFLSLAVVGAMGTSAGWNREPETVDGSGKPFLRPLALAIPPVVFLQITLGAAYRHDLTSVMPHLAVAMGVAFLALIGSSVVLQNFRRPASLRYAAATLITLVLVQVCLGIAAFLMLVLDTAGTLYFLLITVAHVLVGAATLASSVAMAMQVRRSVLPRIPTAKIK
jgi:heme A synthase